MKIYVIICLFFAAGVMFSMFINTVIRYSQDSKNEKIGEVITAGFIFLLYVFAIIFAFQLNT